VFKYIAEDLALGGVVATGEAAHAADAFSHGGDTESWGDDLENMWVIVTTKVAMKIDPGGIRKVC